MAAEGSSQTTEAISVPVLKSQSANLVLRTNLQLYPKPIDALVDCLKRSVLGYALTCTPSIPATLIHRAHYTSNALFDTNNHVKAVFFETIDLKGKTKKVQLTKEKFAEALHLPIYDPTEIVTPSAEQLVDMFNEMGYFPQLEKISLFKKNQLPDLWRYFFSIFLRCLSGRTSGLDSASVAFQSMLFGIYYDVKVDYASILWADFCSHINHSLKGTEISNARFWAIVVHAHYQKTGYVADVSLPEMRYTPITISPLDNEPAAYCAQIPVAMLSKVPMECIEVSSYRNTLVIPYPTRDLSKEVSVKEIPKQKGKRKIAGGPSGPKKEENKRKTSVKTIPKRKQPKRQRKVMVVDESSDSERTPSTVHEEEQEEETFADQPPSPTSPPHTTVPPSPPKTTKPPSPPQTTIPSSPPKSTRPKTPPHTIPLSTPPTTAPPSSEIPVTGIDFSLPEFDLPISPSRQNPTSAALFEAFHMAPLSVEGASEEDLPDEGFVLMKQYKVLNSKLDMLIQAQTGFDPTKPTIGDISEEIESLEFTLSKGIKESVDSLEKKLLDNQDKIQSSFDKKLESAVTSINKKVDAFIEKTDKTNSEVMKTLQGLRSEIQQSTKLEKQLDEARAKIEELTAAQTSSDVTKFTEELKRTNAALTQDLITKLRVALQPLINFSDRLSRPQGVPRQIPAATAGPTTSTVTTTGMGASGSAGAGSSTDRSLENIIAPHMEEIYKARRADYDLMIKINEFARNNGEWTVETIKLYGFQNPNVLNRLPLRSFAFVDSEDIQLDIPFNPKTFAFLQFVTSVPEDQKASFWTNKINFHAKYIQKQSYVWSLNKIKKIISIKEAEKYLGFRNYEFLVLRGADEVESRFSIADFPIMNPMDFIQILDLLRTGGPAHAEMSTFPIKNHLLGFLNNFLLRFAKHDLELCSFYRQPLNTPPVVVRNIARFKNGEILDEPYGVVFKGLRNETEVTIKFFEVDNIGLHPSPFISGMISHVNACHANSTEKKKKFIDHMNWYLAVRKTLKRAYKRNFQV
ncbi:hypothetical protein L2E82_12356 [Cichorium intybus]|uniref:Uncharacterized protein n=1 Tax=Cichorium intybus TaxID=13427 RepID=A0ACB9GFV2_CICIN|nr:hypothetical protein L2E82_12356 [Cichorium intybus]